MSGTKTSDQMTACLKLALERNKQLFSEAYDLNRAALDLLDQPNMDLEKFTLYQKKRRHADRKYQEAIEHLQLIMAEYAVHPAQAENTLPDFQLYQGEHGAPNSLDQARPGFS
jgi:uncharacterized membrane protein